MDSESPQLNKENPAFKQPENAETAAEKRKLAEGKAPEREDDLDDESAPKDIAAQPSLKSNSSAWPEVTSDTKVVSPEEHKKNFEEALQALQSGEDLKDEFSANEAMSNQELK